MMKFFVDIGGEFENNNQQFSIFCKSKR